MLVFVAVRKEQLDSKCSMCVQTCTQFVYIYTHVGTGGFRWFDAIIAFEEKCSSGCSRNHCLACSRIHFQNPCWTIYSCLVEVVHVLTRFYCGAHSFLFAIACCANFERQAFLSNAQALDAQARASSSLWPEILKCFWALARIRHCVCAPFF